MGLSDVKIRKFFFPTGVLFSDVFSSTEECLFVDGLFGDVVSSTKRVFFVDGVLVDVVSSTKRVFFVDGVFGG